MNNKTLYVSAIAVPSAGYSVLEVFLVRRGTSSSDSTSLLWSIVFAVIVALWTQGDVKERKLVPPYEYSFFVFLFWPVVLPYHLVKTRGMEGLVLFTGFVGLWWLPAISAIYTYVYSSKAS